MSIKTGNYRRRKCIYEVRRYQRIAVFDVNMHLVYRWHYVEAYRFPNRQRALTAFVACNHFENEKAVLRLKKEKKHVKR